MYPLQQSFSRKFPFPKAEASKNPEEGKGSECGAPSGRDEH